MPEWTRFRAAMTAGSAPYELDAACARGPDRAPWPGAYRVVVSGAGAGVEPAADVFEVVDGV